MKKFIFVFAILAFAIPFVTFAAANASTMQESDTSTLQVIALLREQIRLLEQIIKILTSRLASSVPSAPVISPALFVPTPLISAGEKPFVRISANSSGGQVSIKNGDKATLSWELSNHNWSYCGKLFGWEGTLKPISGSQEIGPISYNTRYDIFCYINSTKYSDSVTVVVTEIELEPVATTSLPKSTFLITDPGFKTCSLEISRNTVIMGKDSLEATWIIDSDIRGAYFYWRGKDSGVDIGKVYGGKTKRVRIFDYGAYPAKYERYVEMFFSQDHFIGDPYTPGCTTNTIIFEVK